MADLTDDEIRALLSLPGRQRISVHTYAWPLAKEVRRLRAELCDVPGGTERAIRLRTRNHALAMKVDTLRAELAEAVALVRDLIPPGSRYNTEGYERQQAFLAKHKEPQA